VTEYNRQDAKTPRFKIDNEPQDLRDKDKGKQSRKWHDFRVPLLEAWFLFGVVWRLGALAVQLLFCSAFFRVASTSSAQASAVSGLRRTLPTA
jgi:hypothetical protein